MKKGGALGRAVREEFHASTVGGGHLGKCQLAFLCERVNQRGDKAVRDHLLPVPGMPGLGFAEQWARQVASAELGMIKRHHHLDTRELTALCGLRSAVQCSGGARRL